MEESNNNDNNSGWFIVGLAILIFTFYITVGILSSVSLKNSKGWGIVINILILVVLFIGVIASVVVLAKMKLVGLIAINGIGLLVGIAIAILSGIGAHTSKKGENIIILIMSVLLVGIILLVYANNSGMGKPFLATLAVLGILIFAISFSVTTSESKDRSDIGQGVRIFFTVAIWLLVVILVVSLFFLNKWYGNNNNDSVDGNNNVNNRLLNK
jgi:hypothetical protein